MRVILALLALFAVLTPAAAQQRGTDWSRTVTLTRDGTFLLGNPRARRLTEYVSYTCPHCAHFVAEATEPLKQGWVKRGQLAIEVRNAVRDPYDLTAAVLARCGGTARFFALHEAIFANQDAWMEKAQAYEPRRAQEDQSASPSARMMAIAEGTGLSALLAQHGLPVARQRVCLADQRTLALINRMTTDAWQTKQIGGTPAFALDGTLIQGPHSWEELQTILSRSLPALPN